MLILHLQKVNFVFFLDLGQYIVPINMKFGMVEQIVGKQ